VVKNWNVQVALKWNSYAPVIFSSYNYACTPNHASIPYKMLTVE
jgi:hypothetical protein